MRLSRAIGAGVLTLLLSTSARAEETPEEPVERGWRENVPRMRWWEYVGGAGLLGGSIAIRFAVDVSGEPNWRGGILLDEVTYDAVFIDSPHLFRTWRKVGDIGYFSSFAWSMVDPVIAGIAYDWDTALQMTMMNLEAFSVYSMILSVFQLIVRRERPSTRECVDQDKASALGVSCGTGNQNVNRSFIGGHTGTVATAATLTCLHHAHHRLWGSIEADTLPCVTWTAMTALVFTSRTLTGQHYFTDNLLGVGVGMLSGFVPWWLHYAFPMFTGEEDVVSSSPIRPTGAIVAPTNGGVQMQLSALW